MTPSAILKLLGAGGVALVLAGCAEMPSLGGEGGLLAASSDDGCGAAARQDLVGTSVGGLDAATLPENRRVLFPGMAATMDFQPERLNVEVGADDRIARVYCG
jgi:hypothetical protein